MKLQVLFFAVWLAVWLTQRVVEFKVINEKRDGNGKATQTQRLTLIVFNLIEFGIEIALYLSLIRII